MCIIRYYPGTVRARNSMGKEVKLMYMCIIRYYPGTATWGPGTVWGRRWTWPGSWSAWSPSSLSATSCAWSWTSTSLYSLRRYSGWFYLSVCLFLLAVCLFVCLCPSILSSENLENQGLICIIFIWCNSENVQGCLAHISLISIPKERAY